jgi:predicted permease
LLASLVSANYFDTLGVRMFRGRPFTLAEEHPGSGAPVAIASYSLWKKYGGDPDFLGRTVRINGRFFTIVGITPKGFTGTTALFGAELFLPLGMYEVAMNDFATDGRPFAARGSHTLMLVGRLKPGMSLAQADERLALSASRLEQAYPADNKQQTFVARPLARLSVSTGPSNDDGLMIPAALLVSLAAVVLLIASLNVANMMLARGTARRREIAIRLALGGGARRVLRQLFTEGLLLAVLGASAGVFVAWWATAALVRSLARLAPLDVVYSGSPDWRVLAATLAFCMLSTVLFALFPAWSLTRRSILGGLKDGQQTDTLRGKPRRLFARRNLLAMSQIALSLMLLTAAGLLVRNAVRAATLDPGFRIDRGLIAEVDAHMAGYDEQRGRRLYQALLDRLRALPGVESAGLAATVPFGLVSNGRTIQRADDPPSTQAGRVSCRFNIVSDGYFETMGVPVLRGRSFRAAEAASAAIIDQSAATRLWPAGDAVGRRIRLTPGGQEVEIVGVVGKVREDLNRDPSPHVYLPFGKEYQSNMNIHLEAAPHLLPVVRREIQAADANLPVLALKTMRTHFDTSPDLWIARTGARMFSIFGAVALLLATVGLYGVRAYTVALRTREIGIRMAVGADASDALRMVLREGLALTAVGAGVGLALSLGISKLLATLMYGVRATDPLVLIAAPALLAAVSLMACYIPARRAARIEPMAALRQE